MMKSVLYLFFVLILSGCLPTSAGLPKRPDQLRYPPLQFDFPEVAVDRLANGARIYLKEDHELPLVNLSLMVEGGSIYDPLDKTGLSELFGQALATGGSGEMSADAVEAELEGMAAGLSVNSGFYGYTINLSVHRRDLKRSLEILTELLRDPRFDQQRFELARQQMLDGIRRQNDEPSAIANRILDDALAGGHPLGTAPTAETVNAITRNDLVRLHERYFHPANFWFALSGDIDSGNVKREIESLLGDWPAGEALVREFPILPDAPGGKVMLAEKDVPQTTILMGEVGISKDNPDQYALQVANYILGGGGFNSRMMREVRSNRGLAYSVYSYFQVGRYLPGFFIAGSETKSESTNQVVELMIELIRQMRSQPVSAEELELAKQSLINSFVFAFDNTHAVVARKVRLDYFGYPRDYLEAYQQRISAVTVADVLRVSQQYLHPEQLQIVLVGRSNSYADVISGMGLPVQKVEL